MSIPDKDEKVSRKPQLDAGLIQKRWLGGRKEEPRGDREIAGQKRTGFRDTGMCGARKDCTRESGWSCSKKRVEWFGGGRTKLPEQLRSDSWVKEQCGKKWQIYSLNYKPWMGSSFLDSRRNDWTCMDTFTSQSLSRQNNSRTCLLISFSYPGF